MIFWSIASKYFGFVLQGVLAVEAALSGHPGQSKKAAVLSAIQAAAQVGETVPEAHVQVIGALIDSTVTGLNNSGAFTHITAGAAK